MSIFEPHWENPAEKWDEIGATMAARAAMGHIPLNGTFELTPFCNFKCKMCYIRLDKEQADEIGTILTAREWIDLAKQAERAGTLYVLLTGGEPLTRPDFPEIYTAMTDMSFILTVYTNASLVTPEHIKLFSRRPPTAFAVTLYGATPETYERITGDPNGFDKTIRGLELLSKLPTNLEIRTTFIQDNMHELDAIREIANRYGQFSINVKTFKPIRGATADVEGCRLTPAQALDLEAANVRYYKNNAEKPEVLTEPRPKKYMGFDLEPKILNCLAAKAMYWITWDGKMLPCGSFSSPYALPVQEGFQQAWDRLPSLLTDLRLADKCYSCELNGYCPNCPAETQAESGNFHDAAPYICAYAHERRKRFLKTT